MRLLMRPLGAAALAAAFLFSGPAANIQAQTSGPSPSSPSVNISDHKLDQAAAAIERVTSVKQDYEQRMASAPPADQERLADEATEAMVKAVNEEGLSVEEYNSIIQVAQTNPDVRQRILQRLETKNK